MNEPQSNLHFKEDTSLKELQQYIAEMEEERGFTHVSVLQTYLLLVEEVGELAKCIRKSEKGMRTDSAKNYDEETAHEVADIIMVLTAVANRLGVDIESAVREKEEQNKRRVWK